MPRIRLLPLALAAVAMLLAAAPAHAATSGPLACAVSIPLSFSPGVTPAGSANSVSGSGTIACAAGSATVPVYTGSIAVAATTAPFESCSEGAGSGTLTATLMGAGAAALTVTARFTYLRDVAYLRGPVTMTNDDSGFGRLNASLIPTLNRTCFTTPMTRATLVGALTLDGTFR